MKNPHKLDALTLPDPFALLALWGLQQARRDFPAVSESPDGTLYAEAVPFDTWYAQYQNKPTLCCRFDGKPDKQNCKVVALVGAAGRAHAGSHDGTSVTAFLRWTRSDGVTLEITNGGLEGDVALAASKWEPQHFLDMMAWMELQGVPLTKTQRDHVRRQHLWNQRNALIARGAKLAPWDRSDVYPHHAAEEVADRIDSENGLAEVMLDLRKR
jgi:hypothetical protein